MNRRKNFIVFNTDEWSFVSDAISRLSEPGRSDIQISMGKALASIADRRICALDGVVSPGMAVALQTELDAMTKVMSDELDTMIVSWRGPGPFNPLDPQTITASLNLCTIRCATDKLLKGLPTEMETLLIDKLEECKKTNLSLRKQLALRPWLQAVGIAIAGAGIGALSQFVIQWILNGS